MLYEVIPDLATTLVVYCDMGDREPIAMAPLEAIADELVDSIFELV